MNDQNANLKNSNNNVITQTIKYSSILDHLVFSCEFLERVINIIYKNLDTVEPSGNSNVEKFHRNMKKKNKLNRLSSNTYDNIMKPNAEEYFKIKDFLTNSNNKDLKKKYLSIKNSLYPGIIESVNQGKSMDDILNRLNSNFSTYFNDSDQDSDDSYQNCSGFFYYMYFICDVGKNE